MKKEALEGENVHNFVLLHMYVNLKHKNMHISMYM